MPNAASVPCIEGAQFIIDIDIKTAKPAIVTEAC